MVLYWKKIESLDDFSEGDHLVCISRVFVGDRIELDDFQGTYKVLDIINEYPDFTTVSIQWMKAPDHTEGGIIYSYAVHENELDTWTKVSHSPFSPSWMTIWKGSES